MSRVRGGRVLLLLTIAALGCGSSSSAPQDASPDQSTAGTGGADASGAAGTTGGAGSGFDVVPGDFALRTPASGDPTVPAVPTFTWAAAPGAATYDIEIATSAAFGADDVVMKTGSVGTSFTPTSVMPAGVLLYWRVAAVNPVGRTPASNAPFVFTTPVDVGANPHGVAVTPDGKTAVISNDRYPGSVQFVDLATFKKMPAALKGRPTTVAITPDGLSALIVESVPNDVAIFDVATMKQTGTIIPPCMATTLYGLAIKPDGSGALLPDLSTGCTKNVLEVAALPAGTIGTSVDLQTTAGAFGVAVTPDGKTALVTHGILGTSIKRVDFGPNGVAVQSIAGTGASFGVAVTPDGQEALVSSGEGEMIKRVSLATSAVTGTLAHDSNQDVGNLAVTPDGKYAVVVSDFEVAVLSLADGTVAAKHELAGRSVAVTPDGTRALVTGAGATGRLYVIKLP